MRTAANSVDKRRMIMTFQEASRDPVFEELAKSTTRPLAPPPEDPRIKALQAEVERLEGKLQDEIQEREYQEELRDEEAQEANSQIKAANSRIEAAQEKYKYTGRWTDKVSGDCAQRAIDDAETCFDRYQSAVEEALSLLASGYAEDAMSALEGLDAPDFKTIRDEVKSMEKAGIGWEEAAEEMNDSLE